ncbi:hypothetical protein EV424DRAFT_941728 [Suillus variegatus]|nr:hypothetical protein EV424DRAFT_941728 [Suillus variegatus]
MEISDRSGAGKRQSPTPRNYDGLTANSSQYTAFEYVQQSGTKSQVKCSTRRIEQYTSLLILTSQVHVEDVMALRRHLRRRLALGLVSGLPFAFQVVESLLRVGCAWQQLHTPQYELISTGAITMHIQIHYIAGSTKHHRIEDMFVYREEYCEVGNL